MPYKDKEAQNTAMQIINKRSRLKKKLEAEARNEKFLEEIPDTPENLNYGMTPNREEPLTWQEFSELNPEADKRAWINYKLQFSYTHKWKAEIATERQKQQIEERNKYNTQEHDCILWRRIFLSGKRSDFTYNHLENCVSCQRWYSIHKNRSSLDLNNIGNKGETYAELRGYTDFMKKNDFPENNIYTPNGVFPMNSICSTCGTPLNRGKCPICDPDPEG